MMLMVSYRAHRSWSARIAWGMQRQAAARTDLGYECCTWRANAFLGSWPRGLTVFGGYEQYSTVLYDDIVMGVRPML